MNPIVRWSLVTAAVVGLAIDAYTHFDLSHLYVFNKTDTVSQGTLFRVEGVMAVVAAIALVIRQNVWTALFTVAVAGGGLTLLVLYRYVNVGVLGPLPNMYEPIWYAEKNWSAFGEAVATAAGLGLLALSLQRRPAHAARV